jgi:hypothetical protein
MVYLRYKTTILILVFLATSLGLLWSTTGTTAAGTGISGDQVNEMGSPWHITFDSSGALYVADSSYNRVAKWIIGGSTGTIVAGQINGQSGNTTYYLSQPYGVYIDPSNNIYVADTSNHRVQLWASDASSITTVAGTGKKKRETKRFLVNERFVFI